MIERIDAENQRAHEWFYSYDATQISEQIQPEPVLSYMVFLK